VKVERSLDGEGFASDGAEWNERRLPAFNFVFAAEDRWGG
jgi:hypothetical protein